jgi:hypothetical protein
VAHSHKSVGRSAREDQPFLTTGIFLVTVDGDPVYSDGKGNFSKEKNETFKLAAAFVKMSPGDDAEGYRKKASEQLGVELQYVGSPPS